MRIIAEFEKGESARHISHLDLMRAVARAIRRSGIPAKYTAGFNPHLELAFASALSVGFAGDAEAMDIAMDTEIDPQAFLDRLGPCMPGGLVLRSAYAVPDNYPALMAILNTARYRVDVNLSAGLDEKTLQHKMDELFAAPILAMKRGKAGIKEIDIRPMVLSIALHDVQTGPETTTACIELLVTASSAKGTLNPDLLMPRVFEAIGAQGAYTVRRTALYAEKDGNEAALWALK